MKLLGNGKGRAPEVGGRKEVRGRKREAETLQMSQGQIYGCVLSKLC